jgi:hypothetical protein
MARSSFSIAFALALFGATADAQNSGALTATVSLAQRDYSKDADVEVTVALVNGTAHVVDVQAQALGTAVLLLDVRDATGRHLATVPPPVPRADVVHFAPNERRVVKVRLGVFSPPLRAGAYQVGPATSIATGSPVPFRIR